MSWKTEKILVIMLVFSMQLVSPGIAQESTSGTVSPTTLEQISIGFEQLSKRVNPSVVQIFASGYRSTADRSSTEQGLLSLQQSSGSGVILDPRGYIVTNAHVVEGAQRVQVLLADANAGNANPARSVLKQRSALQGAQIVGMDRETDIAVLKIDGENLPAMELADSENLKQGEIVFAFGSPMGLENSVSMGVVSSIARQLQPDAPMIYIQTDAVINPGNSGGPLVNTRGQVVGISTFIFSQSGGSEGLGFAVPSNILKNVYGQIRTTGRVRRGIIGTNVQTITPELAQGLGLQQDWGVVISDVFPGSPGENAGLRAGDVVLSLDGKPMENGRQFNVNLYGRRVGDQVALELLRGASKISATVSVVEQHGDPQHLADMVNPGSNLIPKLGILAIELNDTVRRYLPNLRRQTGVVVASGTSDSPYWKERFHPGDVIYMINRVTVTNLADLRAEATKLKAGEAVALHVERQGKLMYVAFEVK